MVQAAGWRPVGQLGAGGEPGVPEVPACVCRSSSMVIRDLTLRSAASFGSFHLIRLLYDEYMFYLVEHRVAEATGETPIAVMGEVSAPHPHPGRDQPLDSHQLLRSAGHLSAWLGLLPALEDRGPPITPGADSFHPDLQGGGTGLRSGFVAKCFLFPPLSKIFIYAQCSRGDG